MNARGRSLDREFIATAFYVFVVYATVVDKQTRHPGLKADLTLPSPVDDAGARTKDRQEHRIR